MNCPKIIPPEVGFGLHVIFKYLRGYLGRFDVEIYAGLKSVPDVGNFFSVKRTTGTGTLEAMRDSYHLGVG